MKQHKTVLITGASGAIGAALAKAYAQHDVKLILQGRRQQALQEVAAQCTQLGAQVETVCLDVLDTQAVLDWVDQQCSQQIPDIVIANAGVNTNVGKDKAGEDWDKVNDLIQVNVTATLALVNKMASYMKQRGSGQLVLIGSLAAFYGLPVTPSYSASKAAIKAYGEGMRGWLRPFGVGVTVVLPGYVQSELAYNMPGPKPFMWTPDKAANKIVKAVAKNKAQLSFPFPLNFGCWFLSVVPSSFAQILLRLMGYSK